MINFTLPFVFSFNSYFVSMFQFWFYNASFEIK